MTAVVEEPVDVRPWDSGSPDLLNDEEIAALMHALARGRQANERAPGGPGALSSPAESC